jgi:hypothetical protein
MTGLPIKEGMVLFFVIAFLSGCLKSDKPGPQNVAPAAVAPSNTAKSVGGNPPQGEKGGNDYKMGGDFAGGAPMSSVLGDMTVRSTIIQLLDKHAEHISLRHVAEYAEKATRQDLMAFQERDASFVNILDISRMGINDNDLEAISKLKLVSLDADDNQLNDLHAIKDIKTLVQLGVSGCPLNAEGLAVIASLPSLTILTIRRTPITDKELEALNQLPLKLLDVSDCPNLSETGLKNLRSHHPHCQIIAKSERGDLASGFRDLMRIECSLMKDGEYDEADMSLKGIISRWQSQAPPPYPNIARAFRYRSSCQSKLNHQQEACHMFQESLDIYAKHIPDDPEWPGVAIEYANLLEQQHRYPEAIVQRKTADSFWQKHTITDAQLANCSANKKWLAKHN